MVTGGMLVVLRSLMVVVLRSLMVVVVWKKD